MDWRQQPRFEPGRIDRLDREAGGVGRDAMALFLRLAAGRQAALQSALADGDSVQVARLAHMLKSGALALGLLRLGGLCEMIEREASSLEPGATARAVETELEAARQALGRLPGEARLNAGPGD
jgi:HPt (histidine-containing phosphotransfer) domain-containing protein